MLGQVLIPALIDGGFIVTTVSRSNSNPSIWPNIRSLTLDYGDVVSLTEAFQGQDAVIEAFNPSAAIHQSAIVQAAIAAGVSRLITPDFGSDTFNKNIKEVLIYDPKVKAQKELEDCIAQAGNSLSWTAIITGAWYDWAIKNGKFWINREARTITRFGSGNQRYSMSRLGTAAEAVIAVLRKPELYHNRPVYVANHTISTNKLITMVESLGIAEWKVVDAPLEGLIKTGTELWHEDTAKGITNRLESQAYPILGTAALFDENNRYGADFGTKVEPGWEEGDETLLKELKELLV